MVSRLLFGRLFGLLDLLGGFVELVQVLAGREVPLHALVANDMMALGLVRRSLRLALGQVRLRGRLSRHGGGSFGPRMSIISGSHAYFFGVRVRCVLQLAREASWRRVAVGAANNNGGRRVVI